MQQQIENKLEKELMPCYLKVINESHNHSVPVNSQTHFKVIVVSELFVGLRLLARHRMVYALLNDEMAQGVHAVALHTYTPKEWDVLKDDVAASPACRGGGSHSLL